MFSGRRKLPATKAAVAGALGLGAGVLGAATASAAEPTQQELLEQIKALQAKVEQLENKQNAQAPQTQPAAAEQPATVDSVLRDAERRSNPAMLESSGVTAGYNKGKFVIQDEAGNFVLHPQLQFMPRFAFSDRSDAKHSGSDTDTESGFEIRRMKIGFDGNVFTPNFTYLFLWATDRNTGNLQLEEAWGKYAFRDGALNNFYVKGGQFKDPFAHESLTSSKRLLAAERTLLNDVFTGGDNFVQGVAVGWDDGPDGSPFRAEVAYTDGANAINQNFQDFPTTKANFGLAGRVEYLAFGKWSAYEDFTTLGNTQDMLAFGAGADITEAGDTDTLLHTVDVHYETGKLGLYGAYLGRSIEDATVGTGASAANHNGYDWGFIVQAAYLVDKHLEPFVRYDFINFDKDLLPAGTDENQVHEFTAGVNYYFKGHNAKFTADFSYLPNGSPVADTGADILASDGEREFVIRAQFQLLL
jgi:hypothetical protein